MVKTGWKEMDLPENFATCMSRMRDGEGGIIHFEGQINHLIPVHNEQYLASEYYKCEGQLIACWFCVTGLSQSITEYLESSQVNECLPYLSKNDIPDLHVCEKLKQVDLLLFCLGYEDLTDNSCNRTWGLNRVISN